MTSSSQPDLTEFLAFSAHDIKNSLAMLTGMLEKVLATHDERDFDGYKDLATMLYETRRINNDLMQMLTLFKLDRKLYPFDVQPVVMADFLSDMTAQNAQLFKSQGIELTSDTADDLVWHFDEDLLQGTINLALNNASRYCKKHIHISALKRDGMLEIRVEDDGAGYPAAMLDNSQQALGVDFSNGSTGLGMYFARNVASLHKNKGRSGGLLLENGGSLGGSAFIIQIP